MLESQYNAWLVKWWRPMMAYVYMGICIFDFIIAPILWSIAQTMQGTKLIEPWFPMTLQGAGLFHAAMGAIIGVAVWGRSKEKLAGVDYASIIRQQEEEIENKTKTEKPKGVIYGREE